MPAKSKIEWTDGTWNPVTGCTKVSPGCAHFSAEPITLRFKRGGPLLPVLPTLNLPPYRPSFPLSCQSPPPLFFQQSVHSYLNNHFSCL